MKKSSLFGAIIMVAASIVVIFISGCMKPKAPEAPQGKVLEGEGKGFSNGAIKATVTVDDSGKIVGLTLSDVDNTQTPALGGKALETLTATILEKGTIEGVDTVSGATMTSWGVIDAVNAALASNK